MKIAISAGDPSGDEHAAKIITALKALDPSCQLFGMGGSHLRSVGVDTVVDSERDASVMGSTEVIKALPRLWGAFQRVVKEIQARKPDIVLLVDYQEFNILLAKKVKSLGFKTFFYVAPTVWAWRPGRVKNFIRYVDHLAAIYPFEPAIFRDAGYNKVTYVGHPLADDLSTYHIRDDERLALRASWNIPEDAPLLAIFPGSRQQEIHRHLIPMKEAFQIAQRSVPSLHGVIPVPTSLDIEQMNEMTTGISGLHCIRGKSLDVLRASDAGLIKSGTSNLQAALAGLPFTMMYQANLVTELIVRFAFKRRVFSIVNIIRPDTVREIIQENVTAKILSEEILKLLQNQQYRDSLQQSLAEVTELMKGDGGSSAQKVANLILAFTS